MRVALITPWDNAWGPMFKRAVEERGHEFRLCKPSEKVEADVVIHGWTGQTQPVPGARNVMFLRRYELFDGGINRVDWKGVDLLVCVNKWIAGVVQRIFEEHDIKTPVKVIYNAVETRDWKFKQRKSNHRVGMACHVHPKKNIPLALQILAELPENYELHVAGQVQDPCTAEYLNHVGERMRRKVYLYGHMERAQLDHWWEHMGVCLSTSLSEGNPNNVIEAMAKGIKPVVHRWPGAEDQFPPECLFTTAKGAAGIIESDNYASVEYRQWVDLHYSPRNIERVVDLAIEPMKKAA